MKRLMAAVVLVTIVCWAASASATGGVQQWGEWDNGTATHSIANIPVAFSLPGTPSAIQASNGTSYALVSGTVYDWGYGTNGALGNGSTANSFSTAVTPSFPGGTVITDIGDAKNAGLAVDSVQQGWVWGNTDHGEICTLGTPANVLTPQLVAGLPPVTQAAGGQQHSLWLTTAGTVDACGLNSDGQLGNGTFTNSHTPVAVVGLTNIIYISAGNTSSAALQSIANNGTCPCNLYMWGANAEGDLGNGTFVDSDVPTQVPGIFAQVYAGGSLPGNTHTLAITTGDVVESWGANSFGELCNGTEGTATNTPGPVSVPAGVNVASVMAGGGESGFVDTVGEVFMCGQDSSGEVGNGKGKTDVLLPVQVDSGRTMLSGTAATVVDS
jgi:alpha-tubulin suppressor-like RCC1 family protein